PARVAQAESERELGHEAFLVGEAISMAAAVVDRLARVIEARELIRRSRKDRGELAGWIDLAEDDLRERGAALLAWIPGHDQRRNVIDPVAHGDRRTAFIDYDGARIRRGDRADQGFVRRRKLERLAIASAGALLALVVVREPHDDDRGARGSDRFGRG